MENLNKQHKLKELTNILDDMLKQVTQNKEAFREFLQFQTRLYKHSFENILLIYAQNPNATACAELDDWNKIGRRIHKGNTAMKVFTDETKSEIKYIFDLKNTYGKTFAYPVKSDIEEKHRDALLKYFEVQPFSKEFNINFKWAIEKYVKDNYNEFIDDFMYDKKESLMSHIKDKNASDRFRQTVTDCVCYSVCERFNIPKGMYDQNEKSFLHFEQFNSKEMMFHLGNATNYITKNAINQINQVIKENILQDNLAKEQQFIKNIVSLENVKIERARNNEYERSNKGNDISTEEGLVSRNSGGSNRTPKDRGTTADTIGFIRSNVQELHDRELQGTSELSNERREIHDDLRTSKHGSQRDDREPTGTIRQELPTPETGLHKDLSVGNSQEGLGGRDSTQGIDLQKKINLQEPLNTQGSFFNAKSEDIQKQNIACAEAINNTILENYNGSHLNEGTAKIVITEFGQERVNLVLANTIQEKDYDGRFSFNNKSWAKTIDVPKEDKNVDFILDTQPGLLNIFINQARREMTVKLESQNIELNQQAKTVTPFIVDDGKLEPNVSKAITDDNRDDYLIQQEEDSRRRRENRAKRRLEENQKEELTENHHIEKIDGVDFIITGVNVQPVSPKPILFPDYKDIEHSINFNDYEDGDIIGYNREGVKYQVGKIGNINYTIQTTCITPLGEILGTQHIPDYIYKQIQNYRNNFINQKNSREGEPWTEEPVSQEKNKDISIENVIQLQQKSIEKATNFIIKSQEDIGTLNGKGKYNENIEAVKLLQKLELENRTATGLEQQTLAKYSGFGSIPQVFDQNNSSWQKEYFELKSLLSVSEYRNAFQSTLNAHYTSTEVIDAMYKGLDQLGFNGGNVLEPSMGVGNFFGMFPDDLKEKSRLYGVELDETTGKLARQLYPQANVQITGFESAKLQDNFFDVAVGNVPFGNYKVGDVKFDKHNMLIHDYFFAKTLDKVKPDGIIAFITSKGTLDKENASVRKYLAERAEFLGAIRLPNTAFKKSAGTEVTSDIIFLKKRDRIVDATDEQWVYTGFLNGKANEYGEVDKIPLNQYFIDNQHMMLGNMKLCTNMYGNKNETALFPFTENENPLSFSQQLENAVAYLPKNIKKDINFLDDLEKLADERILADPNVKNFCHTIIDGEIYQREDSVMTKVSLPKTTTERMKLLIELRELTRNQLQIQLENCSDDDLLKGQEKLNETYEKFTKKYGNVNSKYNRQIFAGDADFPLLSSIEEIGDEDNVVKADIFKKRTIEPLKKIENVETSVEALAVSLNEKGYIDIGFMSSLSKKTNENVIEDLQGIIFKNPLFDSFDSEYNLYANWETSDEYLSGEVSKKLEIAKEMVTDNPIYKSNIQALESIQPTPLQASEISVRIGSSWIDEKYYKQFILETLKPKYYEQSSVDVRYSKLSGSWYIEKPPSKNNAIESIESFGTKRMNAYDLMETLLNQKNPRIYDRVPYINANGNESEKRVLNKEQTIAIKDKQNILKQEFENWIFKDPARREHLVQVYNNKFNSTRQRQYDGSHLTFQGMNPAITLKKHQLDGISRILYGGNTLLAHTVGAGKTYTMAAAAMEQKRLGLANKPCIVVPNHLVNQWTNEFKRLYPMANVLAATTKDFEKNKRQRFCGRIATGEWDCIVMGHSSFGKIPMSQERIAKKLERDIERTLDALQELKSSNGDRFSIKEMARTIKKLELEQNKLLNSPKDSLVNFEDLGIDALYVDEAHMFKNKFLFTKMTNVAGLSKEGAQKSADMELKCSYINEVNGSSRNVVFATGTPIYTLQ